MLDLSFGSQYIYKTAPDNNCAIALLLVLFPHAATPLHPVPQLHALLSCTFANAIAPCNYCAVLRVCLHAIAMLHPVPWIHVLLSHTSANAIAHATAVQH